MTHPKQKLTVLDTPQSYQFNVFSDFFIVAKMRDGVIAKFGQIIPVQNQWSQVERVAPIQGMIRMDPKNAKVLLLALQEQLAAYEAEYGVIELPDTKPEV